MWHKALECTSDCTVVILGGQGKGSSSKNQFTNNFGHSSWWLSHQLLNVWTNWIMFARLWGKHVTSKVIPCISLPPRKKHMLFPHHPPTTLSPPQKKKKRSNALFASFFWLGFQWMERGPGSSHGSAEDRNGVLWLIRSYSANFSMVF